MASSEKITDSTEPGLQTSPGEQLKYWRGTRQLSQLDLAVDADTSARHLSFIETGRAHPSRELLLKLMASLDVPLRSRNTILINAGYAPSYEKTGLNRSEMEQIAVMLGSMVNILEPYPAMLIDRNWDIIECNKAFIRMCEIFIDDASLLDRRPMNLLRIFLDQQGVGHSVTNLPDVYATMLNRARRMINVTGSSEENRRLLKDLMDKRPDGTVNIDENLPHLVMPLRLKKGDLELNLLTMVATMGAPLNITLQEIQLEFGLPMDDASKEFLKALAS
jgi:transcriptional regulator with XRE-family HTH domain